MGENIHGLFFTERFDVGGHLFCDDTVKGVACCIVCDNIDVVWGFEAVNKICCVWGFCFFELFEFFDDFPEADDDFVFVVFH